MILHVSNAFRLYINFNKMLDILIKHYFFFIYEYTTVMEILRFAQKTLKGTKQLFIFPVDY